MKTIMRLKSTKTVIYMVVTDVLGGSINVWYPAATLKAARIARKDFLSSSHNKWHYPIVKKTVIEQYQLKAPLL